MTKTKTDSQALIEDSPERALTVPRDGLSGEFGQDDISVPVCSLVQPMSKDKGEAGTFWFPDGRTFSELSVVVLEIAATRTLWSDMETGEGIICRSPDRQLGYTERPSQVFETDDADEPTFPMCSECPHSEDDQYARGFLCKKGYTMLLYETKADFPFLFFAKGTAVKPIKQRIVSPTLMRFKQTGKATPWKFAYRWSPKLVQANFKYYVPDIYIDHEIEEDDQQAFADRAAQLRGRAGRQTMEEEPGEESA